MVTKLISACPMHAPILNLKPITGMLAAAGISDRLRRTVICTAPVVTGLLTVGDSWACTNPSLGRGISIGLMHALATAEAVGAHLDDPAALAVEHDRLTRKRVLPWYRATTQVIAVTHSPILVDALRRSARNAPAELSTFR